VYIILKLKLKEMIDASQVNNKCFLKNNEILQLNSQIYFLNIEKIEIIENHQNSQLEYIFKFEFSHLKNYFFMNQKMRMYFVKFLCKKILFSFLEMRSSTNSFNKNPIVDIYYEFSLNENQIVLFD
jgi:hypothetical protein